MIDVINEFDFFLVFVGYIVPAYFMMFVNIMELWRCYFEYDWKHALKKVSFVLFSVVCPIVNFVLMFGHIVNFSRKFLNTRRSHD